MSTGWYKIRYWLPYLDLPKEGELVYFNGEQLPTDEEVRQALLMEGKIKDKEYYFVKIGAVTPCEEPMDYGR